MHATEFLGENDIGWPKNHACIISNIAHSYARLHTGNDDKGDEINARTARSKSIGSGLLP